MGGRRRGAALAGRVVRERPLAQTLEDSFSAVSKPNFASKYAFESCRRDLHNALLCTALNLNFLSKFLPTISLNFAKFSKISIFFEKFRNF